MSKPAAVDPAELSFEQARDELTAVVDRLQRGTESLQESLDLWERGEQLAKRCEDFLAAARERIESVVAASSPDAESPTRRG
ncbi:MAG: exodeoxyribonuclease small subunit [Actinomycetota bacterium]|nr:exodeoxyribonuclease small subunit [Actinomycetota bacterium]